jgi:hypothetical protein
MLRTRSKQICLLRLILSALGLKRVTTVAQRSFAGGEIAPSLYARTDTAKYATSLRTARNFIVRKHGGVYNRPGTELVAEMKVSTNVGRLIPFIFNDAQTYVLEMGTGYIRFIQDGGRIVVSGVAAWLTATGYVAGDLRADAGVSYYARLAHTSAASNKPGSGVDWPTYWHALTGDIFEIPTPYSNDDLKNFQFVQTADAITLVHPSYEPRELRRLGHTNWTLTKIAFGPTIGAPTNLALAKGSGSDGKIDYWAVTAVSALTGEESLPTLTSAADRRPNSDTPRSDVTATAASDKVNLTNHGYLNGTRVKFPQLTGGTGLAAGTEYFVRDAETNAFKLSAALGGAVIDITADMTAGTIQAVPTQITWDAVPDALEYNVYRSTDGFTYGFVGSLGGASAGSSDNSWTDNTEAVVTTNPPYVAAAGQCRNPLASISSTNRANGGFYTVHATLKITVDTGGAGQRSGRIRAYTKRNTDAVRQDAGVLLDRTIAFAGSGTAWQESFSVPVAVTDDGYTTLEIDLVPEGGVNTGGGQVTVEAIATTAPYDKITWETALDTGGFHDKNATPDYLSQPPTHPTLFQAANKFPAAVGYHQQRRLFGGSNDDPETVWSSRNAAHQNFGSSMPIEDSDAVIFTLVSRKVGKIQHLIELEELLVLSSSGEWRIRGDESGTLRPDAINPKKFSEHGAAEHLRPLILGDVPIFVQARGSLVRTLLHSVLEGHRGTDLTMFAGHLFQGETINDWDYAENPDGVVWAARADGVLLSLTYQREHDVWAWTRHDTDGLVENVCIVPEGDEDRIYLIVNRTIGGATKRYVERMASRFFTDVEDVIFMDSALSYDGWNVAATTMTLSDGVNWTSVEQLTITASAATFAAGDVGKQIFLRAADGSLVKLTLEVFTSNVVMTGKANKTVPADLRGAATASWARASKTFTGLSHLEGKKVAVLGDGFVAASPNNAAYPVVTVAAGSITLDRHYAVVHAGLPYLCDLETLDIDSPSGRSIKEQKVLINRVTLMLEESRGLWVGTSPPTGADPLEHLRELKLREDENPNAPVALLTGDAVVNTSGEWTTNGRIFMRQVDPLPLAVLAAIPHGAA